MRLGGGVGTYPVALTGTGFTAASVSGVIADYDASVAGIITTGLGVSTWPTKQGAIDATMGIDADRPAFGATSGLNGGPGVTFDLANTESMNTLTLSDASNSYVLFVALNQITTAGTQAAFKSSGAGIFAASRIGSVGIFDGTAWRTTGAATTGEQLLTWVLDAAGTQLECFRDGVSIGTAAYDGTWSWDGSAGIGTTNNPNMILSRCVLYNRLLVPHEIATLNAHFMALYNL